MKKIIRLFSSIKILFFFTIVYIIFWYYYPHKFISSDPWQYSYRAYQIEKYLNLGSDHVFAHRLGVTLPVAFFYKILGINILTTNLWSLLSVLLIFITVWFALPDLKSRIIGMILCFFSSALLNASTTLYPDVVATAFMAFSTLLLFKRQKIVLSQFWVLLSILALVSLFIAFLAKLSVYWILPLWLMYFIKDLRAKDNILLKRFYFPLFISGALLGFLYLSLNYFIWGSSFARFESVQSLTGHHLWSSVNISKINFIKRLTIEPIEFLFNEFYWFPFLALISLWVVPKHLLGWGYYVVICLSFFWFGTTSFSQYEPMPLVERMALPILPGIYILSAFFISKINLSLSRLNFGRNLTSIIFLCFFILPSVKKIKKTNSIKLHENNIINIIKNKLLEYPDSEFVLISSNLRSTETLAFYFSYNYPNNLKVINFKDLNNDLLKPSNVFVYVNKGLSNFLQSAYGNKNYDKQIESLNLNEIYNGNNIHLFEIKNKSKIEDLIEIP